MDPKTQQLLLQAGGAEKVGDFFKFSLFGCWFVNLFCIFE